MNRFLLSDFNTILCELFTNTNNKFEDSKFLNISLKIMNWLIWSFNFTGIFISRIYLTSENTQKTEFDFYFVINFITIFLAFMFIRWLMLTKVKAILLKSFFMYIACVIAGCINYYGIYFKQDLDLLFGLSIGLILIFAPLYLSDKTRQASLRYTRLNHSRL